MKYAGAYTFWDVKDEFIEKIEGDHLNIIGLPIEEVKEALKDFGVEIP